MSKFIRLLATSAGVGKKIEPTLGVSFVTPNAPGYDDKVMMVAEGVDFDPKPQQPITWTLTGTLQSELDPDVQYVAANGRALVGGVVTELGSYTLEAWQSPKPNDAIEVIASVEFTAPENPNVYGS